MIWLINRVIKMKINEIKMNWSADLADEDAAVVMGWST
jgi:hypothetical protein